MVAESPFETQAEIWEQIVAMFKESGFTETDASRFLQMHNNPEHRANIAIPELRNLTNRWYAQIGKPQYERRDNRRD